MTAQIAARAVGLLLVLLMLPAVPSARGPQAAPGPQSLSANPPGYDEALTQANLMLRQRKYEEALKLFKRANGMKKDQSPECLWGMALAYNNMGSLKDAIETCDRVVKVAGEDRTMIASACNVKGLALSAMATIDKPDKKKCAEAAAAFRKALEANPDLHVAHFNIGMMLMCMDQDPAGIEEMKIYLDRDPSGSFAERARALIENPRRAREKFAPDFSFMTLDGSRIDSNDLRGKVIVLDFWATWCGPCVNALDDLIKFAKRYERDPVVVISVSADTDSTAWRSFIARNDKMTWPQFLDSRRVIQKAFGVDAYPTYIVIDQEGIVRRYAIGSDKFNQVYDAVHDCLKNQPEKK